MAMPIPDASQAKAAEAPARYRAHQGIRRRRSRKKGTIQRMAQSLVQVDADQCERIIFQFLRDVPHLLNADRLGMETSTVRPWPHQTRVSDTIVERFPERFMLCDEVGLGKTIEAGLAIRQLVLSGVVRTGADPGSQERARAVAGRTVREVRPQRAAL